MGASISWPGGLFLFFLTKSNTPQWTSSRLERKISLPQSSSLDSEWWNPTVNGVEQKFNRSFLIVTKNIKIENTTLTLSWYFQSITLSISTISSRRDFCSVGKRQRLVVAVHTDTEESKEPSARTLAPARWISSVLQSSIKVQGIKFKKSVLTVVNWENLFLVLP